MKIRIFRTIGCSVLLVILTNLVSAQSYGNYDKVPFALGLFPPVNTNGTNARNCINQVSINLVSGYSAGLAGVEFAGFSNTESDFVRGAQFAGFGNYVNGKFTGYQFAGFGNFNRSTAIGFQFAGFANFNYDQADGVLAAGFANFTKGKSSALQLSGFGNYCEDVQGAQLSGFMNSVKGNGKVIQLAGAANIITGEVSGLQAAGVLNYSKSQMKTVQLAGACNIVNGNAQGTQIAGVTNYTKGDLDGVQISALLNSAKKVKGLQLGVINIADTIESGVPIGIISFVKKGGFRELEVALAEGMNTQLAFKIGIPQFYNIFAIGTQFLQDKNYWGFGYGIGTHLARKENYSLQLELVDFHINDGGKYTETYNEMQQLKLLYNRRVSEHVSVFAGPSINLQVTDRKDKDGTLMEENKFAPYTIYKHTGDHTAIKGWIGFTAGIHIH